MESTYGSTTSERCKGTLENGNASHTFPNQVVYAKVKADNIVHDFLNMRSARSWDSRRRLPPTPVSTRHEYAWLRCVEAAAGIGSIARVRLLLDTGAVVIVVYGVHDTAVRAAVLRIT